MNTLTIEDVGPIHSLEIPLPESGGVVVLRGRNGSGKSSALDSVNAMLTNGSKAPGPRDGVKRGTVEGLGLKMLIGRKTVRTGELMVDTLEGRLDVSDLVDPGIISPEAADAKRIKALLSLADVKPELDLFAELVPGGVDKLRELVDPELSKKDDILQLASRVKRALEAESRKAEGEAVRCFSESQGLDKSIAEVDLNAESDTLKLQSELEQAIRCDSQTRERQRASAAAKAAAYDARRQLDQAKAVDVMSPADAAMEWERASDRVGAAGSEVVRCREELAKAENSLSAARLVLDQATRSKSQIEQRATAMAGWEQTVANAEAVEQVSDEDVRVAAAQVTVAKSRVERGALVRHALETKQRSDACQAKAATCRDVASQWRQAASGVEEVLGDLVSKLGVPLRVRVADGQVRLVTPHARGEIPYSDLSHGERWRLALDLAIEAVGVGGVLTIRQEGWEALDPDNREMIRRHVEGRGVIVLTAEAAAGELEAVCVGAELAAV